ncbi:uncharacterized protein LOC132230131 isoform X2 [Myotis daubentonii]|uniref:uncharacterized protein LOC132230131 isoform X2 n=1 Tax=Myotis daubentonii TaxID=98922 RepID=UPI002873B051|nr:uncharacterized protein LOC132230131 isoform X2 [Myotis daubentonii]
MGRGGHGARGAGWGPAPLRLPVLRASASPRCLHQRLRAAPSESGFVSEKDAPSQAALPPALQRAREPALPLPCVAPAWGAAPGLPGPKSSGVGPGPSSATGSSSDRMSPTPGSRSGVRWTGHRRSLSASPVSLSRDGKDALRGLITVPRAQSEELSARASMRLQVRAPFLDAVVRKFDDLYGKGSEGKECDYLFTIIAHLYDFHVVQSLLIFDMLEKLTGNFTEEDMELILLMLRNVGFSLRKDDVLSLEMIKETQAKAIGAGGKFQDKTRGPVHRFGSPTSPEAVVSKLISQQSQISTVQRLKFLLRAKFFKLKLYR